MTEYWKSNPRKFCDFCKCWLTDNRPSIEFHENGKKHKENVKKRLAEIGKKGKKEYLQQKKMDKEMEKMEKAALAAFQKDIQADPSLASQYGVDLSDVVEKTSDGVTKPPFNPATVNPQPSKASASAALPAPVPVSANVQSKSKTSASTSSPTFWYEAVTHEGYTYYWNIETNESSWEAPDKYLTLAEQKVPITPAEIAAKELEEKRAAEKKEADKLKEKFEHYKQKIAEDNETDDFDLVETCNHIGPKGRPNPYGKWTLVPQQKPMEGADLQLPKVETEYTEVLIPKKEEKQRSFKEKTFSSTSVGSASSASQSIGFKKRKNNSSFKRNIRRRDDDEDVS